MSSSLRNPYPVHRGRTTDKSVRRRGGGIRRRSLPATTGAGRERTPEYRQCACYLGRLLSIEGHGRSRDIVRRIDVPSEKPYQPVIDNQGALSDSDFDVSVSGWEISGRIARPSKRNGAILVFNGEESLLPKSAWATVRAIEEFRRRPDTERTQHLNELGWGKIRTLADAANALYVSQYLATTHVLTPDRLRLPVTREETKFGRVQTVLPTFDGAPDGWIRAFDQLESVQSHYDFTGGTHGRVRVVLSEPVRKVLQVIKRDMPGRRIAGATAEKFLHNPWAFLGETAAEVISEDEFVRDRASVGPLSTVFSVSHRAADGRIDSVELVVTEHFANGGAKTSVSSFQGTLNLAEFIAALEEALRQEREHFPWNEFDLTVDAECTTQLETAQQVLFLWRNQPDERIDFNDVYTLDGYSERITGIGVAKPYLCPSHAKVCSRRRC